MHALMINKPRTWKLAQDYLVPVEPLPSAVAGIQMLATLAGAFAIARRNETSQLPVGSIAA